MVPGERLPTSGVRTMRITDEWVADHGEAIRQAVFEIMDADPDVTGMEAGRVAAAAESAALVVLRELCGRA